MEIKVLFFARSKELAGTGEATFNLPEGGTTTSLLQAVMQQVSEVIHKIEGRHLADVEGPSAATTSQTAPLARHLEPYGFSFRTAPYADRALTLFPL
jgi:hypothetical protein